MAETYKIAIDGQWTLVDLYQFPHTYVQVYSFLYSLHLSHDAEWERQQITFSAFPWRGGYSAVNFYNQLLYMIPSEQRPTLVSMQYGSPGWMELSLVVATAISIRMFVANFVKAARELHSLYTEIYRGLQERKLLRISVRRKALALKQEELRFVQQSTDSLSKLMGFQNLDEINNLTGNHLTTLKIILSFYRRIRALAEYEHDGKAKL